MNDASLSVNGTTLEQYAIVLAGREDELPLLDVLALAGVDEARWAQAEQAWARQILEDARAGGELGDELNQAMVMALRLWSRRLPPMDEDLRAYLDFSRSWAEQPDGNAFLAEYNMHRIDMMRLDALWKERFERDPELKARAIRLLVEPSGPTPKPEPRPAVIIQQQGAS